MHTTRALRVGAVVAALALVGAACGSDDSGGGRRIERSFYFADFRRNTCVAADLFLGCEA